MQSSNDVAGVRLGWNDLWEDAYPLGLVLIMLIVDLCLYSALAWYLERVIPGQFGPCLPWWFPASKSYWLSGTLSLEDLSTPAPGSGLWAWGHRQGAKVLGLLRRSPLRGYVPVGQNEQDDGAEGVANATGEENRGRARMQERGGRSAAMPNGHSSMLNGGGHAMGEGDVRPSSRPGRAGGQHDVPAAEMLNLRKVLLHTSLLLVTFTGAAS